MDNTKSQKSTNIKPMKPQGTVPIAGKNVGISSDTVLSNPGSTQKKIITGLKKASEKDIFSPSPSFAPPEEDEDEPAK